MPSVSPDVLKKYIQAGKIAAEARDHGVQHVRAGGSSLELANAIEGLIRDRGGECAFPVNIGVNEVAAHYTPSKSNDIRFREGDVVKIDVGAHVDGYPADTAATVEVSTRKYSDLIRSAHDALTMCIEMIRPGTSISAMGGTVARVIGSAGFKPVQNLTGHSMERYNLHAGLSIPNIETKDKAVVEEGMVLAIEPFSSMGAGKVGGRGRGNIYRIIRERKAHQDIEELFTRMRSAFGPFPFAGRWCERLHADSEPLVAKMYRLGMIMSYPVLMDVGNGVVAQAEHSVIVTSDGCRIIT
jgi:methionyl aminopeptidase